MRLIMSTPPARTASAMPERMACAARAIAWSPLEQNRFRVMPVTSTGNPARSSPRRATFWPWLDSGNAHPQTTSSRCAGSRSMRSTAARITTAERSTGCKVARAPSFLPRATAVRTALTITASRMAPPQFRRTFPVST